MFSAEERIRKKSATILQDTEQLMKVILVQRAWRNYMRLKATRKIIQHKKNREFTLKELLDSEQAYCDNL